MSKGPKTLTETNQATTQTQIDPTLASRQTDIYNRAQDLANTPYQAYTGDRFAGFTPDQTASFDAARSAAGAGQDTLGQAIGTAEGLANYQNPFQFAQSYQAADPRMVQAQQIQGQDIFGGRGAFDPGSIGAQQVQASAGPEGYQAYMNPYTSDVIDTSLGDIERARQEAAHATRAQAAQSGAFGGSRSGVAESLTNRDFGNLAASTASGLRQSGFNTALGYNQADQNRQLQAGQGNQQAALGAAQASLGARTQAGIAGQQLRQGGLLQAALANQGADLSAQQANQAAGLNAGQFNAGQLQQGGQFNAAQHAANANAAAGIQAGGAGLLGQQAAQQQQMGAQGADLLSRIGGQQQALDQAGKDFNYQQFQEQRNLPYQNLDLLSQILGRQQYGSTTNQTGTGTQPNPNRGGFLGTLGGLAGTALGGGFGSALGANLFGGGGG